ncbi:PPE family protein [Mycolicibacter icosiumassiliensis]|uniref:PPE family protein n=1 Tax=Mycolicibacter icosiumassiliensis TaxID=1792835 RepID=UPI000832A7D9
MSDFGILPPEINSSRMYAGPGSAPLTAAAAAWAALAGQLDAASRTYLSVVSGLRGEGWSGGASDAMASAVGPYVAWVTALGTQAEETASRARAAAAAYEVAFAATVPPNLVAANRAQLTELIATDFLGRNATAIAATEAAYAEMWAQDVAAMYTYAASSSAATQLTPFSQPPQTTNPAGQTGQSAAVANAVGSTSAGNAQSTVSQLISAIPAQLQALTGGAGGGAAAAPTAADASSLLTLFSSFNTFT